MGTLVAFLLYVYYLMSPIQQLVNAASQYQVGAAAVARIQEAERLPVEPSGLSASRRGGGDAPAAVTFEQVRFRYRPELPEVHHGVSFSIPPRGMTAFVGQSGAGKTTVLSLIERFYEPDAGRILFDGRELRHWPIPELRAAMDAGRVKAAGTHAELVASDPLYAELAATQFLASTDTPVA